MATKMNWLVKQYENKEISYEIQNTKEKMGTIVMPTGAGKSGVMDKDIIYHINNTKGKIIFNISAPILKLCKQQGDDLFNVIENIFVDRCNRDEFMVFINSSADGKVFKDSTRSIGNVHPFNDIEVFERNEKARFAIVISCHKSLYKFAERVEYLSNFATVANYLDEGHLLVNLDGRRDFHKESNFTQKEQKQWDVMQTLCKYSDYLYVLTATPDKTITALVNQAAGNAPGYNIIEISAQELIEKGVILSPRLSSVIIDNSSEITPEIAISLMNECVMLEPNIVHKVLITCDNTDHLERLEKQLSKNYAVFSTTSRNGAKTNLLEELDEYDDIEDTDEEKELKSILETNFIKRVDDCSENCFVLHIRQLREGIDIRTLTDCIICNRASHVNEGEKIKFIQTIGRILRPYKGERPEELVERGLTFEDRLKKHGNVLFVVGNSDIDENGQNVVERQTINFAVRYYGLDGVSSFSLDPNKDYGNMGKKKTAISGWVSGTRAWEEEIRNEIKELEVNIIKFVKENILPLNEVYKSLGAKITINEAVLQIKRNFGFVDGMNSVCDVISNHDLMRMVNKILSEYGIKA